jgi:glycosyltransferase involved in cell wall biosynthesis
MDGNLTPFAAAIVPDAAGTKPLRILYHHRVVSRDGQHVHIDEMIAALEELGHNLAIAAPAVADASDPDAHGGGFVALLKRALPAPVYESIEIAYNLPAFARIYGVWRRVAPDVIYERYSLHLLAGLWLAKLTRTPLLLEVNAPLAEERARFGGLGLARLAERLERYVWRGADAVLPVSEPLAAYLVAAGVDPARITVIPNAIDPARYPGLDTDAAKTALGLAGRIVLGFSGYMREWHGLDGLIEALAMPGLPDSAHLLLVGDGPARIALAAKVAALGLDNRVTFAGNVPRDEIGRYIAAFDIALQPRAVAYASPLKLFEYMAAGKAIVAPDQPNIREALTDRDSALLFAPDDRAAMLAAILTLASDPDLRRRLGAAARRQIDQRGFTWAANARRVAALARTLMPGNVSAPDLSAPKLSAR